MARRAIGARALRVTATESLDSTEAVAERVRVARTRGETLRIVGGGGWLDAGRPCSADATLALAPLRGVTEFAPDDFSLTARASTSLAEIDAVARQEGRWFTLQPFGSPDDTVGATFATATWGPLASAYGTARDHILGCEVVTGRGEVLRAGGRVVKNVAGFDLVRLMTGAWGTLGAITEVTVRLRARPEVDRTFAITREGGRGDLAGDAWRWLRTSSFTPLAAELCSGSLAARLGIADEDVLLVRLGGNEPLVRAAAESVATLGIVSELDASVWDRLRGSEPARATTFRLATLPASAAPLWSRARREVEQAGGWVHATVARGVVRCVVPTGGAVPSAEAIASLRGIIEEPPSPGSRIVERADVALWQMLPPAAADPLSAGIRRVFDPDGVLNPGILGSIT